MNCTIPAGLKGKELFKFLKENKHLLISEKKMNLKKADPFFCSSSRLSVNEKGEVEEKANEAVADDNLSELTVKVVINTTNLLDGHSDVHIPKLWNKSLKEAKNIHHLQEHSMTFKGIIADGEQVKAYVKQMTWRELGYQYPGVTEALIFESTIKRDRNEFMFHEYRKGHVKNHSVGMRYVEINMAINQPDDKYYREEFEAWEKYIGMIANYEEAEAQGYFWAVTEAKVVEGSAVPMGSNWITPTLENNMKSETKDSTKTGGPEGSTHQSEPQFNLDIAIRTLNFFNR